MDYSGIPPQSFSSFAVRQVHKDTKLKLEFVLCIFSIGKNVTERKNGGRW